MTRTVRDAIELITTRHGEDFGRWLLQIRDPAKRCEVYLRALEFATPKLSRIEVRPPPPELSDRPITTAEEAQHVYQEILGDSSIDLSRLQFALPAPTTVEQQSLREPAPAARAQPVDAEPTVLAKPAQRFSVPTPAVMVGGVADGRAASIAEAEQRKRDMRAQIEAQNQREREAGAIRAAREAAEQP